MTVMRSTRRNEISVTTFTNTRTIRIEWGDCDPAGIIYYPRYFAIFDAATAALFECALGLTKFQQLKTFAFAGYPLVKTRAKFLRPTRFGDNVTIQSGIRFGRSSFAVDHRLRLNGESCVECAETRVWVVHDPATGGIKPQRIPEAVRAKFGISG